VDFFVAAMIFLNATFEEWDDSHPSGAVARKGAMVGRPFLP
jgi:hypothetical protein